MAAGEVPYRDFDLEYPPGALPVFWLPTLGPADHYSSIFEMLMWVCAAAMLVLVVSAADSLGASPRRLLATAVFVGLFPLLLGTVVLTRYDLWPAALAAAALAAVLAGRERLGLAVLGIAVAAKIYPVVLLPVLLIYLWKRHGRREAAIGLGAFAAALRGRRSAVRADRAGWPGGLARAPARPAAPDREPRLLAAPGREAARPLRPGRRLQPRLPEPRRPAAGRALGRPDRPAGGPAGRGLDPLRARPGNADAARRRLRRLGRGLRRLREGALAAVPDLAASGRPARRGEDRARGCRVPRRRARDHAPAGSRRATGIWSTFSPWAGSRWSATCSSSSLAIVLAVATARARGPTRSA